MCFVALPAIGAALTAAAPYAAAASAVAGGFSALRQGAQAQTAANQNAAAAQWQAQQQATLAEYNAQVGEQRAGERLHVAEMDAERQRTRNRLLMGSARARAAASGIALDGSPLEVLAFNAGQQAQDVESILLQGRLDARDMRAQAGLDRWGGQNALASGASEAAEQRRRGQAAQQASYFTAGNSLLTGASNWQQRYGGSR